MSRIDRLQILYGEILNEIKIQEKELEKNKMKLNKIKEEITKLIKIGSSDRYMITKLEMILEMMKE